MGLLGVMKEEATAAPPLQERGCGTGGDVGGEKMYFSLGRWEWIGKGFLQLDATSSWEVWLGLAGAFACVAFQAGRQQLELWGLGVSGILTVVCLQ